MSYINTDDGRPVSAFTSYVYRQKAKYGAQFDPSDLAPQFAPYLHTGQRIKVRTTYADGTTLDRMGTVGVTTGWRPAFLLMARSNAHGSSDVLRREDQVIAVRVGRKYVPLCACDPQRGIFNHGPNGCEGV